MRIEIEIERSCPEQGVEPHMERFRVEVPRHVTVLDTIIQVKNELDGSLTFRRSCRSAICGSCAMRINGRNYLACKVLVKDVGDKITVEPLLGLRVIKDLIVDMEPFFDNYKKILPYFINESPIPADGKERIQSQEQRARFDDTTKCILCAACTTSCPTFWGSDDYLGPAALVTAHRFIFDSRDEDAADRLQVVSETSGLARCHTVFNCTMACPREIEITVAIGELKMATITGKLD
jgi:succinate dehydrogenase / fumarate reductase iron-sulfur subunit